MYEYIELERVSHVLSSLENEHFKTSKSGFSDFPIFQQTFFYEYDTTQWSRGVVWCGGIDMDMVALGT